MKVNKRYKLNKWKCSTPGREVMEFIHKYDDKTVEVTDGHIVARIPAEEIDGDFYTAKQNYPSENDSRILNFVPKEFTEDEEPSYPKIDLVIPALSDVNFSFGIDVKLLLRLSELMGTEDLELQIIGPTKAIRVFPLDRDNNASTGFVMPKKLENEIDVIPGYKYSHEFVEWLKENKPLKESTLRNEWRYWKEEELRSIKQTEEEEG